MNTTELKPRQRLEKILANFLRESVTKGKGQPLVRRAVRNQAVDEIIELLANQRKLLTEMREG